MSRFLILSLLAWTSGLGAAEGESPVLTYAGSASVGGILARIAPGAVAVSASGTATAISELSQGRAQIVGLSRAPSDDDLATIVAARKAQPVVHFLGFGAVALFVQRTNPVAGITSAQLAEACAGRLRWGDLGVTGPLATTTIQVVANHSQSGSTRLFADVILGGALPGVVRVEAVGSSVAQAAAIEDAVLAVASLHQDTPAIRPIALDGVVPTPDTIRDGSYRLARPLLLMWLPGTPGIGQLASTLNADVTGKRLVEEGVVTLPTAP